MDSLLFGYENQENWDKVKVKTFLRSLLFRDKNQKFQDRLTTFWVQIQENQDKFKVKTFFRDHYSVASNKINFSMRFLS